MVGWFFRALHWVTIQMLCVPVDEEIPEVSDSVVKAITGESAKLGIILSFICCFPSEYRFYFVYHRCY